MHFLVMNSASISFISNMGVASFFLFELLKNHILYRNLKTFWNLTVIDSGSTVTVLFLQLHSLC